MAENGTGHAMLKEIEEQPALAGKLIGRYLAEGFFAMPEFREFEDRLKAAKRVLFWGIGSSYHAAIYGNYLFEDLCRLPGESESADELVARASVLEPETAVVALSQSGETTDLIEAVKQAKMKKALTIAIVNNRDSTLASLADVVLFLGAGEERAVATTKVFAGQLIALALLAAYLNQLKSRRDPGLAAALCRLPQHLESMASRRAEAAGIAGKLKDSGYLAVLGRHWHYPIALETALKLKETAYAKAEGLAAETFRHGPRAVVDKDFFALVFLSSGGQYGESLAVYEGIIKAGGQAIAVTEDEGRDFPSRIIVPRADPRLQPVVSAMAGQYLAYYLALARGLDPDNPRNIFKYIKK